MTFSTKNTAFSPAPEIWIARLDYLRTYRSCLQSLLSSTEQVRGQRYLQQDDRDRYLGGRALSKLAIAKICGIPPEEISVVTATTGKPSVTFSRKNIVTPAISISHAGDLIVVALQYGAEIGVDVELFNHDVNLDDLMGVVCSSEEIAEINLPGAKNRAQKFYEFWVLKEAYLKATGEGLSADARRLVFSVDTTSKVSLLKSLDSRNARDWDFLLRQYDEQHVIALASRRDVSREAGNYEREAAQNSHTFMDALPLLRGYYSGKTFD
ncbi:MAG: 4'-phosphopantetheinyl transferase superfamily protein [Burkholderiales bacterium]|nr:4'-phosphopantetheinyl transferase superfamily protein [Burkholderiales bacterium]MBI3727418.1 4'-phosphopantetheinyl transferase superfamily protein [Burkholderiales bacterium]